MADHRDEDQWWRQAVVYQIYPRSFADSGGDGIGDLRGVISRIAYLAELGIDAVWLSPFYPSALVDGGYDVDDYRAVDPVFGTLADFDELVAGLHAAGLKVVIDIVPNHTSSRHAWFAEALAAPPGSAARARYIFRDGAADGGPPADWVSRFGGPAWSQVPDGQWYLHLFAPEQPDLNWDNPEVRDDFLATLRFWSGRGVDGFRVDVAHGLVKNLAEPLPSQARLDELRPLPGQHPLWDRDEVHEIYAQWRQVFDEYSPPRTAVAEAWLAHPSRLPRYASATGLGQAFNFDLLEADWDAGQFRSVIAAGLEQASESGASSTWVLSNHDVVRHASRYGLPAGDGWALDRAKAWVTSDGAAADLDHDLGLRRARAATLLVLALPGSVYLYQGEELGLHEVPDLPASVLADPTFRRSGGAEKGRDGCRVPIPWTASGPSFGFGPAGAHLPQPAWFGQVSVEAQAGDPASTLALYRQALALRRRLAAGEELAWAGGDGADVVHFRRPGGWESVTNFAAAPVPLPAGRVVIASGPLDEGSLPPDTTAWIVRR